MRSWPSTLATSEPCNSFNRSVKSVGHVPPWPPENASDRCCWTLLCSFRFGLAAFLFGQPRQHQPQRRRRDGNCKVFLAKIVQSAAFDEFRNGTEARLHEFQFPGQRG